MASLIDDLVASATSSQGSVVDLLRRAKVVASKLGQTETTGWIDAELSGHFGDEAPGYRKVPAALYGRHPFGGMFPVTFADDRINAINRVRGIGTPIAELEDGLRTSSEPTFFLSLPPDAAASFVQWGAPTAHLYHGISRSSVEALVQAVRTRVLEWGLALDKAGIRGEGTAFSDAEQNSAQQITIHFNGTTNFAGVIGTSSGIAAQNITQKQETYYERARAISTSLREASKELSPEDGELLRSAADSVEEATKTDNPTALRKALAWVKASLPKVGGFVAKAALEHEIGDVIDLIPM